MSSRPCYRRLRNTLYAVASWRFLRTALYGALWVERADYVERYGRFLGEGAARLMTRRLKRRLRLRLLALVNSLEPVCGFVLPYGLSAMKKDELFEKAFELARQQECRTVLILGASGGEGLTEACLAGVRENPNRRVAVCVNSNTFRFAELRGRLRGDSLVSFRTVVAEDDHGRLDGVVRSIMQENEIDCFDLAVFDASAFTDCIESGAVHRAMVVLVHGANTVQGYRHVRELMTEGTYTVIAQDVLSRDGYIVLRR